LYGTKDPEEVHRWACPTGDMVSWLSTVRTLERPPALPHWRISVRLKMTLGHRWACPTGAMVNSYRDGPCPCDPGEAPAEDHRPGDARSRVAGERGTEV
jgi:hypothetical protein